MLEAMSFGLVPVVTLVSGAEDVITDGESGFLCAVGDIHSMCDRLEYLASHRTQLAAVSTEAAKVVLSRYTVEGHMARFKEILEKVMFTPLATGDAAAACL
jgi:glycosyltransferase involved in cell wall biosynthesis